MLVLCVARCVSRFTLVDTIRCVSMLPSAGGSGAIYVVLTGFDGVGTAACRRRYQLRGVNTYGATCVSHSELTNMRVIEASGDQTVVGPEVPGS